MKTKVSRSADEMVLERITICCTGMSKAFLKGNVMLFEHAGELELRDTLRSGVEAFTFCPWCGSEVVVEEEA